MKIGLRVDRRSPSHVSFTVFVNGANANQLCLREGELDEFEAVMRAGAKHRGIAYEFQDQPKTAEAQGQTLVSDAEKLRRSRSEPRSWPVNAPLGREDIDENTVTQSRDGQEQITDMLAIRWKDQ